MKDRKLLIKTWNDELKEEKREKIVSNILKIALLIGIVFVFSCQVCHASMKASWYSIASLKAEKTWQRSNGIQANGKKFNENALTCATGKKYLLGTTLLITNKNNGKSVLVVVTDRIAKRLYNSRIDLSKGAFERIGSLKTGLIPIKIKVIGVPS